MIVCYHCNTCSNDIFLCLQVFVLVIYIERTTINGLFIYPCVLSSMVNPPLHMHNIVRVLRLEEGYTELSYVCMYVCMYVYIYMYVCIYVCMYVCMYVLYIYILFFI